MRISRPALRRAGGGAVGLAWAPFRLCSGGLRHAPAACEPHGCLTTISTKGRGGGLPVYQGRPGEFEVEAHLRGVAFPSWALRPAEETALLNHAIVS